MFLSRMDAISIHQDRVNHKEMTMGMRASEMIELGYRRAGEFLYQAKQIERA